jgi:hypothetical protein
VTVVAARASEPRQGAPAQESSRLGRLLQNLQLSRRELAPIAFVVANAIAFMITQPGVGDLWAARARESAARSGVGLTYWFSWFSGGTTPGNYSILTPYVSVVVGTELLGAVSAVACVVAAVFLVRGTNYPIAASFVAAVAAAANLWAGRIPFLFGSAFAVAAFLAVRRRRPVAAAALAVASALCSPVSGAFLALGLFGSFLTEATKTYRRICFTTAMALGVAMVLVAFAFGNPGPDSFTFWMLLELLGGLIGLLLVATPDFVRTNLWLAFLVAVPLFFVPNGMGGNVIRLVWFYLPVAVLATSRRRLWVALLLVAPMVGASVENTGHELYLASNASSFTAYYQPLAHQLSSTPGLASHRLEVVWTGAHTGYEVLLGKAMLARGWESQDDQVYNGVLSAHPVLDPIAYQAWLDNNAVGYVALPHDRAGGSPEWDLVSKATPGYLTKVWGSADWTLYRVADATPVAAPPATITRQTQARLTVTIPCACRIPLRVRYSKFLEAANTDPHGPHGLVATDLNGWASVTTTRPGTYYLEGRISGLFH